MTETTSSTPSLGARYWFLVAGVPLVAVDVTIMDALLPDVVRQLNISVANASLVDAITVTVAGAFMVPAGKLGDLMGAKRVLLAGLIILITASSATGIATGLGLLIAARIGQGIAFAMILTEVIAILNRDYPQGPSRARAFTLFFAVSYSAIGFAPLVGALLADYGSWRWAFLVNAPLAAIVVVGVHRLTSAVPAAGSTRSFDLLGSVLLFFAMGLILFAIQQGSRYGWLRSSEHIVIFGVPWTLALSPIPVMLGLGAILLTAFILLEHWRAKRKLDVLLDTEIFRTRSYVWGTIAIAMIASAAIGALLVVSLYAEYILGASAITAGLIVAPLGLGALATVSISGWVARFSGKTVGVISIAVQLIAMLILIAAFSVTGLPFVIVAAMVLLGVSVVGMSAMTNLALRDIPAQLAGEAAGIQTSTRYLICGFAMVVMTTLLISVTAYGVQKLSFTGVTAADRSVLDAVEKLQRPATPRVLADATEPAQRKAFERYNEDLSTMRRAIDDGTRAAVIVAALMLALGLLAASRLPGRPASQAATAAGRKR